MSILLGLFSVLKGVDDRLKKENKVKKKTLICGGRGGGR